MKDRIKPDTSKFTQYVFSSSISKIIKTVFIKGRASNLPKLRISHFMIFIIIKKATEFGNNTARKTAKDVPRIPHSAESG